MKLYTIRDWNSLFENNRSRTVDKLGWVAIPNRHDGENYTTIITSKNGAEIFAAWVLIVQVASKCTPRGSLVRGNQKPHDAESLSLKTRAPRIWFEKCLAFLEENTDWLDVKDVAPDCQPPVSRLSVACQAGDEERREGNELKGKEREGTLSDSYHKDSRSVLHYLNEKTGHHYREIDANLKLISARLNESGVTFDGVKEMIDRMAKRWLRSPQQDYLRPETLFGASKFDGYYATKDLPAGFAEVKPAETHQAPDYVEPKVLFRSGKQNI